MSTVSPSKKGTGVIEKIIAITSFIVSVIAIVVIARMPSEGFAKSVPRVEENKSIIASVKPVTPNKTPTKTEAIEESREIYLETAKLQLVTKNTKENKTVEYKTETLKTFALKEGEKKIIKKGENGIKEISKQLTYKGDQLQETEVLNTKTLKKPVNEVVLEGVDSAVPVFMVPANGRYTSSYGERWNKMHKGVDIGAPIGTDIKAAEGGVVTYSGERGTYGNCVVIKHKNGYETLYAHISKLIAKKGETVNKGDVIAEVGSTGRSTGPHLHFEVKINGNHKNPMNYLKDKK